ncbi:MAG: hypothetical protein PVG44_05130 [Desulfobacterales bacterium]|jgi:hypothetical protein
MFIKFFNNRELSNKFRVNLAKWKRWSREFLPPDPLGGLQSGYARQYNPDDAFTVFLGGHLVANLKFTIPEARLILNDLHDWLVSHGFYFYYSGSAPVVDTSTHSVTHYHICIFSLKNIDGFKSAFYYVIRGILQEEFLEERGRRERQARFIEIELNPVQEEFSPSDAESYHVLNIDGLRNRFLSLLQINNYTE